MVGLSRSTPLSWGVLAAATGVLLLNLVLKWLLPARSMRAAGVSWRALFTAGAVAIAGFFLVPVIGAPIGFVGGLYAFERVRLGSHGGAWSSTRTAMRAIGFGMLIELFACLLVMRRVAGRGPRRLTHGCCGGAPYSLHLPHVRDP